MLTLKQSPFAIIGILLACSLTEGDPESGKLLIALLVLIATILYVLVCNFINQRKDGEQIEVHR